MYQIMHLQPIVLLRAELADKRNPNGPTKYNITLNSTKIDTEPFYTKLSIVIY